VSAPPSARALYLDVDEDRVLAHFHAPADASRRTAVVLCPPFGWEDMCSYRSRRDWAERLAADGHPTLRLDLPGSGDSSGGPGDPNRLDAWTKAVAAAAGRVRAAGRSSRVAVIGIGLGGLVAVRAVLRGAMIDELVLWGAPARGRTLARELRAFSRLEVAYVLGDGDEPAPAPAAEGELVANGYRLSAETVRELESLDLSELPSPERAPARALLLERDGLSVDGRLQALLERAGTSVTLADGRGFGLMTREPQDAQPPTEVFAQVGAWLAEGEAQAGAREDGGVRGGEPAVGETPAPAGPPTHASPAVGGQDTMRLLVSGAELSETPVYVEREVGRLFGVLSEPLAGRRELCAVLLNAGPQRHTGPNRMWVEAARRWATRGVPTLRIDLEGIGESDGDAAALVRVANLYVPGYVEQAVAALDMLEARGLPRRFVLVGLCAGAYWSMHAALKDERVAGVMMLNPRALIWDEWDYTVQRTRDLRQRLLLGSTWRKVLRGEITLARHLETAHALAARAVHTPLRARERIVASRRTQGSETDPVEGLFDRLRERDQRALLLLTGKEPLRESLGASGTFDRLDSWPNLRLALLGTSADTHTLTPLWLQQQVHELIDAALEAELERLPG
jgi:pimeloyl-ACP methyl ester carboxylesterase